MRRLHTLAGDTVEIFGPGTDLIVSLVAVLMIMFAVQDIINFKQVRQNQEKIVNEIAATFRTRAVKIKADTYEIIDPQRRGKIIIKNDATLQRFSFGSDILFESGKAVLRDRGKEILEKFAKAFKNKKKLGIIKEIQIQGHADIEPVVDDRDWGNLQLAADRALEVYKHLKQFNINPYEYVMSATSFGEYMPVERKYEDNSYSMAKLEYHNNNQKKMDLNRRIEIVLIYSK
jgi:flagellar motor protein MotB